jgi:hypothetical protein
MLDINKFSFAQMTSNSDGKTSGSGTIGILICSIGSICFLLGSIDLMFFSKTATTLTQSIIFTGMGAGLLGYRKSQEKLLKETPEEPVEEPKEEPEKES